MTLSFPHVRIALDDQQTLGKLDMLPVRQCFQDAVIDAVDPILEAGIRRLAPGDLRGKKIAVTAGSRGIKGIGQTLRSIVRLLQQNGAEPFIVPAMGSHGGATDAGQVGVLEKLGQTEAYLGAPIRSSMDVVSLGTTSHGLKVFCDKLAYNSDGIIVCNRIKPHNVFKADYESGLVKMLVIGLGKHEGAIAAHNFGFDRFHELLPAAAELSLAKAPVLAGIGLVENAYGGLAGVHFLTPGEFLSKEPELLRESKRIMGRLLLDKIDILVVDEIGKDISGGGLDANVTGRSPWGLPGFTAPPIQRIIVRDLTQATNGNGIGIGLADFTTRRCAEKIDLDTTYTNALTAHSLLSPKIPVIVENDREALAMALRTLRGGVPESPRIVRIKNTKELESIWVSEGYREYIGENPDLEISGQPQPLAFDTAGMLIAN